LLFTEGQSGDTVTTLSLEQAYKHSHKLDNNNLAARNISLYQSIVNKLEFLCWKS